MKYLDTNILVRLITGDDHTQAQKAIEHIERGSQNEFAIVDAVLVELCFVLEFHEYKMTKKDISAALEALLAVPQIFVTNTTLAALAQYKKHSKLDYVDCLLMVLGGKAGVVTFDTDLQKVLLS